MSKLRITPIGTCRIHTPLRRANSRYPVEIDGRRNYGFVHSSDEALQLVRFLQGEKSFQPQVAPLVARDGNLAQYESEAWQPSDLHIVEISSSKRISCGGDAVQSNFLSHHFADFFGNAEWSTTFWNLVKKAHRRHLIYWLRHQRAFLALSPEDRDLLSNIQVEQQSFKSIKSDMEEIVERLGRDRLLFVTHVNAVTPDGDLIPTRDRLIRWVKMAAEQLDAPVFDPTPSMQAFGQEKALERGGLDLTHYTPAYSDRVYDEMHQLHVASFVETVGDVTGDEAGQQVAILAARLEAMLEVGDFFAAAKEVHSAIAEMPDALPLIELRGVIRSRIGDFAGATDDLSRRGDDTALSQAMRIGFAEALNASGKWQQALQVAQNLFAEEFESASMYQLAARAADKLGLADEAIGYAKQAFRAERNDLSAALHALVLLTAKDDGEEAAAWRHEILENIGTSAHGAFEISMWAIQHRDEELFAAALNAVAPLDKGGTIDLFEDAFNAGMYRAVARSVEAVAELGRLPRSMAERRLAVINGVLEKARSLLEEGRPADGYELAHAILGLADVTSSQIPGRKLASEARKLANEMVKHLRSTIRDAYKDKDGAEVIRIGEAAGDLLLGLPDGAVLYARSLHDAGRSDEALDVIRRAYAEDEHNFAVMRWAGRLGAMAGDYSTALEMYGAARRSGHPDLPTIKSEMDRFFAGAEDRALKQLRKMVITDEHQKALRLAALIKKEIGAEDRVERELNRMHAMLRRRLKEIEQEGELEDRESVLRRMAQIRPSDQGILRRFARELMRQLRFAEAAEIWERVPRSRPQRRQRCEAARALRQNGAAAGQCVG